jgi:hypothetical protein
MGQKALKQYLRENINQLQEALDREKKRCPDAFDEDGDAKPAMQCYEDFELWDCGNFDDVFQAGCDFTDIGWIQSKLESLKEMLKILEEPEKNVDFTDLDYSVPVSNT